MRLGQLGTISTFSGIVAILIFIPVLFYSTSGAMINVWMVNETFTHGFLILPISLWLMWQKKAIINRFTAKPEPLVLILVVPILSVWLVSEIAGVQVIQQLAMVALIPVVVWLLFGKVIVTTLLFPLFYLIFAIPLGQSLIPPMMEFTANFTTYLISVTGIPIYRDGLYFSLPSGNWSVVEECSGVRYIIASLALGAIYAYINYNSTRKRLIFIFFALLIPIIANGIRAYGIVMIGHFSGMELATGADHLLYGWVFFGIVIFSMFYLGSFFWEPVVEKDTRQVNPTTNKTRSTNKILVTLAVVTIISIVTVELFAYLIKSSDRSTPIKINLLMPDHFSGWNFDKTISLNWNPVFKNPDADLSRIYRHGKEQVQLNIGYFGFQREGAEAISSQNKLTDPYNGQWKVIHTRDLREQNVFVTETVIQRMGKKLLVWNWYLVGRQQTPNAYVAKIFEAYNYIILGRKDAAIITLATSLGEVNADARSKLRDFWSTASQDIEINLEAIVTHN